MPRSGFQLVPLINLELEVVRPAIDIAGSRPGLSVHRPQTQRCLKNPLLLQDGPDPPFTVGPLKALAHWELTFPLILGLYQYYYGPRHLMSIHGLQIAVSPVEVLLVDASRLRTGELQPACAQISR